jgi:hypothetical protein
MLPCSQQRLLHQILCSLSVPAGQSQGVSKQRVSMLDM